MILSSSTQLKSRHQAVQGFNPPTNYRCNLHANSCLHRVLALLQVYWLDIDYLEIAEAALHCAASMTALLYVEEWYKEQHGQLIMGRPTSAPSKA